MEEESLFAFQPPPRPVVGYSDETKYAHLTQPTNLQADWEHYYAHQSQQQRPVTAPTYAETYNQAAGYHPQRVPTLPTGSQHLPPAYLLPDEPQQQRPATSHTTYCAPHGLQYAQLQRRTSSSVYPFSHDPFPASHSRPTTADARLVSSRPSTAGTYRPDTGNSVASTIVDGVSAAYGPDGRLYQFIGLKTHKKRARRRFDEIERMYACNYAGCSKSYGCLNHLNAHVAAQKHGPKRLPAEFKEMRKEWRAKKKAEEAARKKREEEGLGEEDGDSSPPADTSPQAELPPSLLHHPTPQAPQPGEPALFQFSHPTAYASYAPSQEHLRPQTAPSNIDLFAFGPPPTATTTGDSPATSNSPPTPNGNGPLTTSPFRPYSQDPALGTSLAPPDDMGALGLPKRRGSLTPSALDHIPEFSPAQFAYQPPSPTNAHALQHAALSNSGSQASFTHDWLSGSGFNPYQATHGGLPPPQPASSHPSVASL